jgi:hypothetical protein
MAEQATRAALAAVTAVTEGSPAATECVRAAGTTLAAVTAGTPIAAVTAVTEQRRTTTTGTAGTAGAAAITRAAGNTGQQTVVGPDRAVRACPALTAIAADTEDQTGRITAGAAGAARVASCHRITTGAAVTGDAIRAVPARTTGAAIGTHTALTAVTAVGRPAGTTVTSRIGCTRAAVTEEQPTGTTGGVRQRPVAHTVSAVADQQGARIQAVDKIVELNSQIAQRRRTVNPLLVKGMHRVINVCLIQLGEVGRGNRSTRRIDAGHPGQRGLNTRRVNV